MTTLMNNSVNPCHISKMMFPTYTADSFSKEKTHLSIMRSFVCEVSKDWDFLKAAHNQPKSSRISFQTHYKFSSEKAEL